MNRAVRSAGFAVVLILSCGSLIVTSGQVPRAKIDLPAETTGRDRIVETLVSIFDRVDIVALGESHRRKFDSDLRLALVRHPEFARKVHFILVEFANTGGQVLLDRYIRGEDVSPSALPWIWRDTVTCQGSADCLWESPVYAAFFAAVREVNRKLPTERKIRVLAGDPPYGNNTSRDASALSVLQYHILTPGAKALVIYGSAHLDYQEGGITKAVQATHPGRIFVASVRGGTSPEYQKFERAVKSPGRPVLVSLRAAPFKDFEATEFLGLGMKKWVDGVWVDVVRFEGLTLGEMEDAFVYLGNTPEVERTVEP